jgi:putative hemolysin
VIDTSEVVPQGWPRVAYGWVQPVTESLLGFHDLARLYQRCREEAADPATMARRYLEALQIQVHIDEAARHALEMARGPTLLAINHPFGGLEFMALAPWLEEVRPGGWVFLANSLLCSIPEFGKVGVPLDPIGRSDRSVALNRQALVTGIRHLRRGGLLGVFPAGRVSHLDPVTGVVTDRPWSDHVVRIAAGAGATLVVLHIPGGNSPRFLRISPGSPRLRGLFLCQELARPSVTRVEVRLAAVFNPAEVKDLESRPRAGLRLQSWCLLRADADTPRVDAPAPGGRGHLSEVGPVTESGNAGRSGEAVRGLKDEDRLMASGRYDLLFLRGDRSPPLMEELGRAREFTFRKAGQGTGREIDLADEDRHYHHLILWHRDKGRVAGAYRVGIVNRILEEHGREGLYLETIFRFDKRFYARIGPSFELSRSFIHPGHQKDRHALSALWKGLGAAAVRHRIRTLYGSVTISNDHHPASQALLVEHLQRSHADEPPLARLVRPRNPFVPRSGHHAHISRAHAGEPVESLGPHIEVLEEGERGIPPLMRYYCGLGARFLSFHVEPSFANAVYCLLRVDLPSVPAAWRRRYMPDAPHAGRFGGDDQVGRKI